MNIAAPVFTVQVHCGGTVLGQAVASVATCIEDAHFRGVLSGRLRNDGTVPSFAVAPVWRDAAPPVVAGLLLSDGGTPLGHYDLRVFQPRADAIIHALYRDAQLAKGDSVDWRVVCSDPEATAPRRFRARITRDPYPFRCESLPTVSAETCAVEIDESVLDAIRDLVTRSSPVECAGLLVGHLLHDAARRAAVLRIVRQIPVAAGQGGASSSHFTFGPNSFAEARETLARARDGAVVGGWWHSHPPCADCPKNPSCTADTVFFSTDDWQVHASAFPAAYMIGLVAGKVRDRPAADPGFRLYAWKAGSIAERPLRVSGPHRET